MIFNDETTNDNYQSCAKVLLFRTFIDTKQPIRCTNYAVIQPIVSGPPLPMHPSMPWLHADYLSNNLMVVSLATFNVAYVLPALPPFNGSSFPDAVVGANYFVVIPERNMWGNVGWD